MEDRQEKPNVVIFTSHDSGTQFGCYGAPVETPEIDETAEEGVVFTNNFCTAPQCTPSRGSIMTGKYPHSNGLMGLVNYGWKLPSENKTLPEVFREAGYSTHLIGLQHETNDPHELGYEEVSDRTDFPYLTQSVVPKAQDFFERVSDNQDPFLVSIGVFETHRPFPHFEDGDDLADLPPFLFAHPGMKRDFTRFKKSLKALDHAVGRVRKSIEENGLRNDTLFIFTIDHGIAFPRAKCTLYDPGIRTALIMVWPEKFIAGRRIEQLVSNVDILPTLCDLLGFPAPREVEGRSYAPLLLEEEFIGREFIHAELTYHDIGYNPMRGTRSTRFKYIRNMEELPFLFEMPDDIRNSDAGRAFIEAFGEEKYNQPRPQEELYDLHEDPLQRNNLADDSTYADTKARLKRETLDWMKRTSDPILEGKIEADEDKEASLFYETI
ncbi:MAG: sulfatase-like hydrolase/transferase [Candidatus Lokiarchaeota archaeon]|nr:sulfatase-like hydrolase/transferase [Candidatus Lokiarchaeota archaeon]